jgi:hypothetical protein
MGLDHVKKKLNSEKRTKPFIKRTVIINPGGRTQIIKKRVSIDEIIAENSESYVDNPEDPNFPREMEGW